VCKLTVGLYAEKMIQAMDSVKGREGDHANGWWFSIHYKIRSANKGTWVEDLELGNHPLTKRRV
jgi:hypothetical protein